MSSVRFDAEAWAVASLSTVQEVVNLFYETETSAVAIILKNYVNVSTLNSPIKVVCSDD